MIKVLLLINLGKKIDALIKLSIHLFLWEYLVRNPCII